MLNTLTIAINTRWKILPVDQKEGVRNYLVGKILELSDTGESMKSNHALLSRMNLVLVQILKEETPSRSQK